MQEMSELEALLNEENEYKNRLTCVPKWMEEFSFEDRTYNIYEYLYDLAIVYLQIQDWQMALSILI